MWIAGINFLKAVHFRPATGPIWKAPSQDTLVQWIGGILKQNGRKITKNDVITFLSLVSLDMENIRQELEKLVCYTMRKGCGDRGGYKSRMQCTHRKQDF